ncbi:MAG: FAD-binding protein [Bacteroidales bacterium]|nr:FAD-binding protein [Bacteroidales bacterium]
MIKVFDDFDLSARNTFRMKVRCRKFIEYDSAKDLETLDFSALPGPVLSIGGGSNLLFSGDFPGTLLHSRIEYVKFFDLGLEKVPVAVGAGVCFDFLCAKMCAEDLWGLENLSLIPGDAGAAAVQNIGAYGVEFKDIMTGVSCYDTVLKQKCSFKREECGYGYRESIFKKPENKGRYIITGVMLELSRKPEPRLDYAPLKAAPAKSRVLVEARLAGIQLVV